VTEVSFLLQLTQRKKNENDVQTLSPPQKRCQKVMGLGITTIILLPLWLVTLNFIPTFVQT
jgi:hypothetical protein